MEIKTEIPDKIIELSLGDKVEIYVRKKEVAFHFYCDGTGNCFALTKEELRKWL
jgi:hypothetical protein